MKTKKVPMRTCVGCFESRPKKELIRIVHSADGDISLDLSGKKAGRGAYICPSVECFKKAKKLRRLDKAFECEVTQEAYDMLEAEFNLLKLPDMPKEAQNG